MVCACAQYMSDGGLRDKEVQVASEERQEGRHPELGLQGGFQSLGQACPQGAEEAECWRCWCQGLMVTSKAR